jgi:hypothetical protein
MIELDISEEQIGRAKRLYKFSSLNNSIMSGTSNIYGAIGEVIVYDALVNKWGASSVSHAQSKDYDILVNGYSLEIKTKRTTVKPKPFFNCSVSTHNPDQKCNYYMFVRVMEDMSKAYILGAIERKKFFSIAELNNKGEPDGKSWSFKGSCYNLPISKLSKFSTNVQ